MTLTSNFFKGIIILIQKSASFLPILIFSNFRVYKLRIFINIFLWECFDRKLIYSKFSSSIYSIIFGGKQKRRYRKFLYNIAFGCRLGFDGLKRPICLFQIAIYNKYIKYFLQLYLNKNCYIHCVLASAPTSLPPKTFQLS